jgi:hypothetical protein
MQSKPSLATKHEDDYIMKVAVIGCAPSEIISACHFTISRFAKEGHSIYAIIVPSKASEIASISSSNGHEIRVGNSI